MKAIINFFKRLFGKKVEVVAPVSTPKPAPRPKPTPKKPSGTGLPKSAEIKEEINKPTPKRKPTKRKPRQGGSAGNGRQPYNTK